MRLLFFFVHPAKYHLFKHCIDILKRKGHTIDIAIVTKDILEDLIIDAGWEYTNIFPEGRRNKNLPILVATFINLLKTIVRLHKYTKGKKYDLFITDDLLVFIGKLKRIPTLYFQDDDLDAVPESAFFFSMATQIVAPACSKFGRFEKKKISYEGNHELAYLNPNYFIPDYEIVESFNPRKKSYFILRLVSLTASHDRGKSGISDEYAKKIIKLLEKYGEIFITAERELPIEFEKYRLRIKPSDIAHALYFAEMVISDSQTMTSEAAVLGTPALRFNDFVGKLSYLEELEHEYNLTYGFGTSEPQELYDKIEELLKIQNLKEVWAEKRAKLLKDKIDVTAFMVWLIENYPESIGKMNADSKN